jgi:hypothetical protein
MPETGSFFGWLRRAFTEKRVPNGHNKTRNRRAMSLGLSEPIISEAKSPNSRRSSRNSPSRNSPLERKDKFRNFIAQHAIEPVRPTKLQKGEEYYDRNGVFVGAIKEMGYWQNGKRIGRKLKIANKDERRALINDPDTTLSLSFEERENVIIASSEYVDNPFYRAEDIKGVFEENM